MNVHLPAARRGWPTRLVNLAVVVVVLALAAATFVLSYSGVHAIALQAGVSVRLSRVYPATFDAVLVIACAAAVMLRDARWWARGYAWLAIILTVAAVGATDAVHAMNVVLPHRKMEGVVAAAPWVLVLLGFSLMLTMLRHSRAQHAATAPPATRRASRRAEKRALRELPQPTAEPIESPAELTRPLVLAAALPPATTTAGAQASRLAPGQPAEPPVAEPSVADEHLPTLALPALAEPEAASAAERHDQTQDEAATREPSPAAEPSDAPAAAAGGEQPWYMGPAEQPVSAPGHTDDEAGTASADDPRPVPDEEPAFTMPAGTEGADAMAVPQHDYWDTEEDPGPAKERYLSAATEADKEPPPFGATSFPTVPRLNRVRATPIPPEEDEE